MRCLPRAYNVLRFVEAAIDARVARMNHVLPAAMTSGYEALLPQMQADEKDKHVLAAPVDCRVSVLVTERTSRTSGLRRPAAMRSRSSEPRSS
ncbi:hypothetical protein BJY22_002582 [Kribbella shirazensis]|uniref:Uncharacterized protein n=1 Tax=Kribbella shirazensis TaxID=1105143 RepID=A0A7X5V925_9ACTN|nr:hypothetical protein [Kribbella shirazensis]